jgi:hypothetical protein
MQLNAKTREFLRYLRTHPNVRREIRATIGQTLLYAGSFFKPMWKEMEEYKAAHPEIAAKETLGDVLRRIPAPGTSHATLFAYVDLLDKQVPLQPDGFTIWRALSGIFAANASGGVSFQIGSDITTATKVFASTEIAVLSRNPNISEESKDMLAYYERCIRRGEVDINTGFISA